jgi:hypothetical protein
MSDLLSRLDAHIKDAEAHEQGGCSPVVMEAFEALKALKASLARAIDLLSGMAVPSSQETGSDTYKCPTCGEHTIYGLDERHAEGCELAAFLRDARVFEG